MKCPICKCNTKTPESRQHKKGTRRRRQCESCLHRWTTYEVSENILSFYESEIKRIKELEKHIHELSKKQQGRSGQRTWTDTEKKQLIILYQDNLPYRKIAEKLGKTYSSVDKKIYLFRKQGIL